MKLTGKFLKVLFLPALLGSLVISCSTELITNDLQPVEIQSNISGQPLNGPDEKIEHGVFLGVVTRLLPDDRKGLKHQVFMMRITGPQLYGEIIQVSHDIDYAPYVPLQEGSRLEIKGDIILNISPKVLHWTHRAYNDSPHPDGYIRLNGVIYN